MGKMKEKVIDSYDTGYKNGFYDGVAQFIWECGDCGNKYEPTITTCPNYVLHKAILGVHSE
jgi:hypothetical protein